MVLAPALVFPLASQRRRTLRIFTAGQCNGQLVAVTAMQGVGSDAANETETANPESFTCTAAGVISDLPVLQLADCPGRLAMHLNRPALLGPFLLGRGLHGRMGSFV